MVFGKKFYDERIQDFKMILLKNVDKWAKDKGIIVDSVEMGPDPDDKDKTLVQIILAKTQRDKENERNEGFKETPKKAPT